MKVNKKIFLSLLAIASVINSKNSFASGYSTNLTSTSGLANSYAGSVTGIHDASDVFFNPSVTTNLSKNQMIASVNYMKLKMDNSGSSGKFSNGAAASGGDSGDIGANIFVPAFYLSSPINDRASLNFAVTSPFGLPTKYDNDWVGRYNATESSIKTVNLNPSVAYKISEQFSIGAGLVAQYYKSTFTKEIYTGGSDDATSRVSGSDWGYGYNLGANYKLNDQLKLGIGYRSKIDYKLSGKSSVQDLGLYSNFIAKTSTPESLTAGFAYKPVQDIELAYDVTWTKWSRLKRLSVNAYQNSNLSGVEQFNWHDSLLHSVGANFTVSDKTIIRTGMAYEKSAITNANREPRIPGSDAIWTTVGFNQKIGNGWSFDGTYLHQFYRVSKVNINNSSATTTSLSAKYKTSVDVISVALKKDF